MSLREDTLIPHVRIWAFDDLFLPVVPVGWTGVLIKIVRVLRGLFLSFKVGDGEPSAVLECGVLYADEFPAFFAPAVEVVLDVFDYWFYGAVCALGVDSCFYGNDFVPPFGHVGRLFRVRQGLGFHRCILLAWFFRL